MMHHVGQLANSNQTGINRSALARYKGIDLQKKKILSIMSIFDIPDCITMTV